MGLMQGFADLHNHQFANLGFGGRAFHGRVLGAVWRRVSDGCQAMALEVGRATRAGRSPGRIGVLQDGVIWAKQGPIDAPWVREKDGCQALAFGGTLIGVLEDGVVWVKQGPLDAPWVREKDGCQALALGGNRIGVLQDGVVWVKEGALDAPWVRESERCQALALAGNRIGILQDGVVWVKEGPLNDLAYALPWCDSVHGPGGAGDLIGSALAIFVYGSGGVGHLVGGYPEFDGWPRWNSITHQAVYEDWLHRAVEGGLRLMVMLAVNNEFLCGMASVAQGRTCGDMEAVDLQLAAAKDMEAHIDAKCGGIGKGWYRIAYSPSQAREAIEAGKLAVVLGVEVDYLFDSYPGSNLTEGDLTRKLREYQARGVRHLFPIHFGDNLFGGTAFQNGLETAADYLPATPENPLGTLPAYVVKTEDGRPWGYQYRGGRRNAKGLTSLGRALIREMMALGMIIDVDHMSARSKAETMDIAESVNYPIVSGHTGFTEISRGDKNHEGQLLPEEIERIRKLGGMVSVIVHQGSVDEISTWRGPGQTVVEHKCGNTSETVAQAYLYAVAKMKGQPVGFGTDFNGFAGLPGPRFGPERCPGGTAGPAPGHGASFPYPFKAAATGIEMPHSVVGQKTFDIAVDGLAHVGLLPDFIAELEFLGLSEAELAPLLSSAEGYVKVWERALRTVHGTAPAVCSPDPAQERMDVFVRGTDDACWYRSFDGRAWSPWVSLGGVLTSDPAAMAVNGTSWVFVRGTDDAIYYLWTPGPGQQGSGWQRLDVPMP
jgi:microsomal dipeptidase-like Zn-dependent dipeptidase